MDSKELEDASELLDHSVIDQFEHVQDELPLGQSSPKDSSFTEEQQVVDYNPAYDESTEEYEYDSFAQEQAIPRDRGQ